MRIVIALGGNALLRRGEPMTADVQRRNVRSAVAAIAPLADAHELVLTHGNGPQVGLLALESEAYAPAGPRPLDVLDAESEGWIGYLIAQELGNALPRDKRAASLLTQVEVDAQDAAFAQPTKPIGPVYSEAEAGRLAEQRGWQVARDGDGWRRVVASPKPLRIIEIDVIELLLESGVIVICAGGGGIPVVARADGSHAGVEAVIDKDLASALLARRLEADALLLLTDIDGVYANWGEPDARLIRSASPSELEPLQFEAGTMRPKVAAAREFVSATGGIAGIGALADAQQILDGRAGTLIAGEPRASG